LLPVLPVPRRISSHRTALSSSSLFLQVTRQAHPEQLPHFFLVSSVAWFVNDAQPAVLFEVFPYRYYKRGYGPLGGEYGVVHGGAMSPPGAGWLARAVLSMLPTKVGAGSMDILSL
jgi:hypothetical protein